MTDNTTLNPTTPASPQASPPESVMMTDRAASRIREISANPQEPQVLRLSVNGGGCSGFQYDFALEDHPQADDLVIEHDGAKLVIDPTSLPFIAGATLDFVDDLMGQAFKVKNPQAKSSCGCGVSFTI